MRSLRNLKQENLLFFDIETASVVPVLRLDTPLFDSWAYKVNKSGDMNNNEIIESYSQKAGLYPEFAKVVSIVVGKIVKGKIFLMTLDHDSESDILNEFNAILERNVKCKLVGFVSVAFDSPFVFKRMLINKIEAHDKIDNSGLKPWEVEDIDLAMEWKGNSFERASLLNAVTAFGLPSPKSDISGADVGRVYWKEGRKGLTRISEYCEKDVVSTINLFRAMILQEPLELGTFAPKVAVVDPLIQRLFDGGKFGAAEKKELKKVLLSLDESEREKAYIILDATSSAAKGKKTNLTKAHIKAIKKEITDGK
tara:strand:- start:4025 stop:4954 length:930 start_codon:yes stop_codon:yes gene_type:complete